MALRNDKNLEATNFSTIKDVEDAIAKLSGEVIGRIGSAYRRGAALTIDSSGTIRVNNRTVSRQAILGSKKKFNIPVELTHVCGLTISVGHLDKKTTDSYLTFHEEGDGWAGDTLSKHLIQNHGYKLYVHNADYSELTIFKEFK